MREQLIAALKAHAQGEIAMHKANVEVYLQNPVGIGEHPDIIAAMDIQIEKMAHAEEKLLAVKNHFIPDRVI